MIVGTDAGWWLPITASRANTTPPINYASEDETDPDYRFWINKLASIVIEDGLTNPNVYKTLEEYGVTHIYIGQLQGQVNPSNNSLMIDPAVLLSCEQYQLIYHQDRVWIFEIVN